MRHLCWDKKNVASSSGVQIRMHHPVRKGVAVKCDDEWEGVHNGYASVIRAGDEYRMYYRADSSRQHDDGTWSGGKAVICLAVSRDGKTFFKPNLNKYYYNGTKNNNIVFSRDSALDNFSVIFDTNPKCPAAEKFKALSSVTEGKVNKLAYYASSDGYDFRFVRYLAVEGTFDSFNVIFWDEKRKKYFLYSRGLHTASGKDFGNSFDGVDAAHDIRDVRVATSKDFTEWTSHGMIGYPRGQTEFPLYTNQIQPYVREKNTLIGFPVRYLDRAENKRNFDFMPLADRHAKITEKFGREGTSLTDCVIMTSDDGFTFDRRDEAFFTPGPENRNNWWYGNCYFAYGLVETQADEPQQSDELSMYTTETYRIKPADFVRYTVRLDGFFSYYGEFSGGVVITKKIKVTEDEMRVNFASSAVGSLVVEVLDENGVAIEGYKSYEMFGDSTSRPVEFQKPLALLKGKKVKVKLTLKDCHLYSYNI